MSGSVPGPGPGAVVAVPPPDVGDGTDVGDGPDVEGADVADGLDVATGAVELVVGEAPAVELVVGEASPVGALDAVPGSSADSPSPHPGAAMAMARTSTKTPVRSAEGPGERPPRRAGLELSTGRRIGCASMTPP